MAMTLPDDAQDIVSLDARIARFCGHDHAHEIRLTANNRTAVPAKTSPQDAHSTYLIKLDGPLDGPLTVQQRTGTLEVPAVMKGQGSRDRKRTSVLSTELQRQRFSSLSSTTRLGRCS